uniref:NDUFA4 mitochondrial complex associated like 2 n=1 Tax=Anolis carolinensis TaxID=28377 RepID=A0A803TMJ4_ANOCA
SLSRDGSTERQYSHLPVAPPSWGRPRAITPPPTSFPFGPGLREGPGRPQQQGQLNHGPLSGRGAQLIPLIGFIGLGLGSAALYLLRLAIYSPDVSWDRKNNPEPWNKLSPNDQYKFMAVSTDYKALKKDRPDF